MPRARTAAPPQKNAAARRELWICAALFTAAVVVFAGAARNDFIGLDDDPYVVSNAMVQRGWTLDGLVWAFRSIHPYYWQPLTWLSHMTVCQFFGLDPAAHHLVNVLIHAASGVLLFVVLRRMTGAMWRSAAAAALFLIHPLRVESVAWVAERKDVLAVFFSLLTCLAYVRYAEDPKSRKRYALVVVLCLCALMSKPMAMPLPALLLILDYWPLRRTQSAGRLLAEKLPLFALAAAVGVATVIGQREFIQNVAETPLSTADRLWNVPLTYLFYLWKTVWPHPLGLYYAYQRIPVWAGCVCWAAVLIPTALALRAWARRESKSGWWAAGWLWWVVALVPTIWITDRWDRFTYLPSVGLMVLIVWGTAEIVERRKLPARAAASGAAVVLATLGALTIFQTSLWRDRLTLYTHAVDVYGGNKYSQNNLGRLLLNLGNAEAAAVHLQKAVSIDPNYAVGLKNLGNAYVRLGRFDQARDSLTRALVARPDYADASFDLGMVDQQLGRGAEAMDALNAALRLGLAPNVASRAHIELGGILWRRNRREEALDQFRGAVLADPGFAAARKSYAAALEQSGRIDEAIEQLATVLSITPDDTGAREEIDRLRAKRN